MGYRDIRVSDFGGKARIIGAVFPAIPLILFFRRVLSAPGGAFAALAR
jgi:hypothetical protein